MTAQDFRKTVRFFLSVMFATPHQLGWDPTMIDMGDGTLAIQVRDQRGRERWYRTEELLSDLGANSLFGRGTRVWSVRRLTLNRKTKEWESTGPLFVLKDSWIDEDRPREGELYRELRRFNGMKEFLLEVEFFGDVYIKEAKNFDHTRMLALKKATLPRFGRALHIRFMKTVRDSVAAAKGVVLHARVPEPLATRTEPRMHTRLVLNDVCTPLNNLSRLEDIFRALAHTALGT